MAKTDADDQSSGRSVDHKKRSLKGKSIGGVAIIALVGLYALARPAMNERFGWDLPAIRTDAQGQVQIDDGPGSQSSKVTAQNDDSSPAAKQSPGSATSGSESTAKSTKRAAPDSAAKKRDVTPKSGGPLAARVRSPTRDDAPVSGSTPAAAASGDDEDLLYGILKEVAKDRYVSPAGLQYTPGSAEGHRLEHLRRHTKDDPRRGIHGVFDGGMEKALQTIDKAYDRAKKGQRTTKKVDGDRTIYTVDMGGRIGFIGGQEGNRKRNPMARRVQLVLEGTRVITAYPK